VTRWWNELVAVLAEATPGGIAGLALSLVVVAAGAALVWYHWPLRLPSVRLGRAGGRGRPRRPRWRRPHWPGLRWRLPRAWRRLCRWLGRRGRRRPSPRPPAELPADQLPDLPAGTLTDRADQLAAEGRYAEAVRERLRAIVRELIEREVIEHRPGWTVTELARAAGHAVPDAAGPLRAAGDTFSAIWYAEQPATGADDQAMRRYAESVHQTLMARPAAAR
jgi:hypothetical protein